MKKKFFYLAAFWMLFSVGMAAQKQETILFSADYLPKDYSFENVDAKRLLDPVGNNGSVISFTLPADTYGKDKSKRPEIILKNKALLRTKLGDYDEVVLSAYNPSEKPINLVLCFVGKHKHFKGATLQPHTWSHSLFSVQKMKRVTGEKLRSVRIFNTNPVHARTFMLKSLKLTKNNFPENRKLDRSLVISDFKDGRLPNGWATVGGSTEIVKSDSSNGKSKLKVTFPAYRSGSPAWPSLQIWPAAGAVLTDWSLFSSLSFTLRNPGFQMIPLTMLIQDANGNRRSFDCLLAAEQTVTKQISLRSLGNFDISRIRQIDFFMHKPAERYQFFCDDVRLNTISIQDLDRWSSDLDVLTEELKGIAVSQRKYYSEKINNDRKRLKECRSFAFSPQLTVAQLRMMNKLGQELSVWINNSTRELTAGRIITQTRQDFPKAKFGVAVADSMTKVMIVERPLRGVYYQKKVELALAKNEYESTQVVVIGAENPQKIKVKTSTLKSDAGTIISPENITVSLVGYVKTKKPLYKADYHGWWPDPLLESQHEAMVRPGEAVPFWIRIKTPREIPAGTYRGKIMIEAEDSRPVALPFEVKVFDFSLPSQSPLKIATNFQVENIGKFWGNKISAKRYEELLDNITETLAEYKINLDSIYRRSFSHPKDLKIHLRQLQYLKKNGLLKCFNICYVGGIPKGITDPDHPSVAKSIHNALSTIRYWKPILKKEGLWEYAQVYGFDEMPPEAFPVLAKVFGAIKEEFPDLPIATTAYDYTFGTGSVLGSAVDIFIPLTSRFDPEMVKKSRAQNHKVWWYICVIPHAPYANWLIEYPAIDARMLMGVMSYMYRPDGFLYYSLALWRGNSKPLEDRGPYTQWNPASYKTANGDGYLFYPGANGLLSSVRAENFRDGLEDYYYFMILEKLMQRPEDMRKYANTLAVPPSLAVSLKEFTKNPELLRKKRLELAKAIEKIKKEKSLNTNRL
jgi:hypothetical protein